MKMKNNALRAIAAGIGLSFALGTAALAADLTIDSIHLDHKNMIVTVEGTAGEGDRVTLKVMKPDGVTEDYFGQTVSADDGTYKFRFILGEGAVEDKLYGVYVFSDSASRKAVSGFKYYNESVIADALARLNSASAAEVGAVITEKNDVFGLPTGIGSSFYALKNKQPVYDALCGKRFMDLDSLREAFKAAVALETEAEAAAARKQAALDAVNNASAENMETVFGDAAAVLEININTKCFIALSADVKNEIYAAIAKNDFSSISDLNEFFEYAAAVHTIKNGNRETVAYALDEYNSIFNCNDNPVYKAMSSDNKANVRKKLVGIDLSEYDLTSKQGMISAVSKIKGIFAAAVTEVAATVRPSAPAGGGSGGGGSGSGVMVIPQPTPDSGITAAEVIEFTDISSVPWAEESIRELARKGIIDGFGDGTFRPDENVTREQFVKMLVGAFDLSADNAFSAFKDVDSSAWYYDAVSQAVGCGVVNGISDDYFGTGDEITRQDMTVMSYRAMDYLGIKLPDKNTVSFTDDSEIADYAKEAVEAMARGGIINGMDNNVFAPQVKCTRAMAAKVIYELYRTAS